VQKVVYHPEAELELIHSLRYYEEQSEGLGVKYLLDLNEAVKDIVSYPEAWPLIEEEIRRRQLRHFPYGIFYRNFCDHIRILAISHLHREPDYWKDRK
jgi:plasmid stabilization system protein ParE